MKYRKKPVAIEAIQWDGFNHVEIQAFCPTAHIAGHYAPAPLKMQMIIPTLEGDHHASIGDFIIRGVQGEFYPCREDIFRMTYEPAEE